MRPGSTVDSTSRWSTDARCAHPWPARSRLPGRFRRTASRSPSRPPTATRRPSPISARYSSSEERGSTKEVRSPSLGRPAYPSTTDRTCISASAWARARRMSTRGAFCLPAALPLLRPRRRLRPPSRRPLRRLPPLLLLRRRQLPLRESPLPQPRLPRHPRPHPPRKLRRAPPPTTASALRARWGRRTTRRWALARLDAPERPASPSPCLPGRARMLRRGLSGAPALRECSPDGSLLLQRRGRGAAPSLAPPASRLGGRPGGRSGHPPCARPTSGLRRRLVCELGRRACVVTR